MLLKGDKMKKTKAIEYEKEFEIYEKGKRPRKGVTYLKLEKCIDGISLVIVNSRGKKVARPYVLSVNHDGTLTRQNNVNGESGLQLNRDGRIKQRKV